MLDKMDPEVAKKAIEQFPNFSDTMKEILKEYKASLDKALESNDQSVKAYYDSCDAIISACQKELEKDDLTFEQRREIIEQMISVTKMKGEKDSENKKFIVALGVLGLSAVAFIATTLAGALGSKAEVDAENKD